MKAIIESRFQMNSLKSCDLRPETFDLWAKTDRQAGAASSSDFGCELWLSLVQHSRDSADVGRKLAEEWLSQTVLSRIGRYFSDNRSLNATKLLSWFAGVHDLGKATIAFQSQIASDPLYGYLWEHVKSLPESPDLWIDSTRARPHSYYSELIIRRWLVRVFPDASFRAIDSLASIAGCHHGRPSGISWLKRSDYDRQIAEEHLESHGEAWSEFWWDILEDIANRTDSLEALQSVLTSGGLRIGDQLSLAGFVSTSDWIASNQELFPLTKTGRHESDESRAGEALKQLSLTRPWTPQSMEEIDFRQRFSWPSNAGLRPCQEIAMKTAGEAQGPTMLLIEDEVGRGKTEAALLAGEILAERTGAGGFAFALPSMITTDAMLSRVIGWSKRLKSTEGAHSIRLMHSRALLNPEFERILKKTRHIGQELRRTAGNDGQFESVIAHAWFSGRKGVLSEFLVCTVDQILMMALATRYVTMRHLGLAGKVIVIDEVHSYDVYTSDYLGRALTWLAAQEVSVILLSATLSTQTREELIARYKEGLEEMQPPGEGVKESNLAATDQQDASTNSLRRRSRIRLGMNSQLQHSDDGRSNHPQERTAGNQTSYSAGTMQDSEVLFPRLTSVSRTKTSIHAIPAPPEHRNVHVAVIDDDLQTLIESIADLTADGGVIGIVCNTVSRAQKAYADLSRMYPGSVDLLHSQFTAADRAQKENLVARALGAKSSTADGTRPEFRIVVGTQVLEQSLDIDFDALITDLAPTDSLVQRAGRMHRHKRTRPKKLQEAKILLRGFSLKDPVPDFDPGSQKIYGKRVLLATAATLCRYLDGNQWCIRHDAAQDVEATYSPTLVVPELWSHEYDQAKRDEDQEIRSSLQRAKAFQLTTPKQAQGEMPRALRAMTVVDADLHEAAAQASVRDIEPALEVCLVQRLGDSLYPLQWLLAESDRGIALSDMVAPPYRQAQAIADSVVRLPRWLVPPERLGEAIDELELRGIQAWQNDFRLRGQLIVHLDENLSGQVLSQSFHYDREIGIVRMPTNTNEKSGGNHAEHNC